MRCVHSLSINEFKTGNQTPLVRELRGGGGDTITHTCTMPTDNIKTTFAPKQILGWRRNE
jgi:hypothetical protein